MSLPSLSYDKITDALLQPIQATGSNSMPTCTVKEGTFSSAPFLDQEYIVKSGEDTIKSMLVDKIRNLTIIGDQVVANTISGLFIFDTNLKLIRRTDHLEVFCIKFLNERIVIFSDSDTKIKIEVLDKKWQCLYSTEIDGIFIDADIAKDHIILSTDARTQAFNYKLESKWIKSPKEIIRCFYDKGDQVLTVLNNRIEIFDVETGLMGWQKIYNYSIEEVEVTNSGATLRGHKIENI